MLQIEEEVKMMQHAHIKGKRHLRMLDKCQLVSQIRTRVSISSGPQALSYIIMPPIPTYHEAWKVNVKYIMIQSDIGDC